MTLSSEKMMKLMAYADGELEGAERKDAERLLATDVDAVRFVEQIAGLGELVAMAHEASSGKVAEAFDVADAVMSRVDEAAKKDVSKVAPVVSLSADSWRAGTRAREKRRQGVKAGVGLAAVLALAASVLLFMQQRDDETPMATAPRAPAAQPAPAASGGAGGGASSPVLASAGTGVDVSTAISAGNSVSVFYLPTANDLSTSVVVWVDETGEK